MPTFERCQSCIARGVPMADAPIRPEGALCDRCLADQVVAVCIDHGFDVVCAGCQLICRDGGFVIYVGWLCMGCRWERDNPS